MVAQVLECYSMMATKIQGHVEAALDRLLDLANQDPNNVPVLLCMATGFMMLRQTPKARNQLKRVQKVRGGPGWRVGGSPHATQPAALCCGEASLCIHA